MAQKLTIGKLRGLQQCATSGGALAVLALDHRQGLKKAMRPKSPDAVTPAEMSTFKQELVAILAPAASAVLLDPEVGGAQSIASGVLPGNIGLIMAVEATGYTGPAAARRSRILPGWSMVKARRMGASAVKLLVYYHPDSSAAPDIETLVRQVAKDCAREDLLFFLEPLSYSLDPSLKKFPSNEKRRVVVETARRLVLPGVDVLKAEFPLDVDLEPDERVWAEACAELSAACSVPWVVLSAGVSYEIYLQQVIVACRAGASGVAAGRAVWKEVVELTGQERLDFLQKVAYQRMERLTALDNALARPWTEFYSAEEVDENWYERY
ncbi:MAG: tagatose 1,6-diphosphate aldolase [Anaerolineae bacterium]|nr:tagatose 1,6-diphosphate aldolase [Anaerolineae bacterium]